MADSENATSTSKDRSHVTTIIQVTSLAILGVVIILGNLATIVTFVRTQSLRRRCYYLLICLSVADVGVGIVASMNVHFFLTVPHLVTYTTWLDFTDTLTGFASILTLVVISTERFYAIFYPFRHRTARFKYYAALFAFPWALATAIASLNYVSSYDHSYVALYTYLVIIIITVSLFLIVFNYIAIAIRSKKSQQCTQNRNQSLRDKKLVVTILIVTLSSIVTWLPIQCLFAVIYFCKTCSFPHINVFFAMKFLQFCNSGLNVFVYFWRMNEFRKTFFVLFYRKPKYVHHVTTEDIVEPHLRTSSV